VTEEDLLGHPSLVFFGFTHCPDVCPMTLAEIAAWLDALGDDGDALEAYFVTVDPARDTPEVLAEYVGYFSERITGLTGTQEQLAAMAQSYRVYYRKVELGEGDYVMDHTAAVYLMDSGGRFAEAITFQASTEEALAKLRRLVAGS
jgi:protein SCO1/2